MNLKEKWTFLNSREVSFTSQNVFFSREAELQWLNKVDKNYNPQGVQWAVYGTRRTGKTTLIRKFILDKVEKLKGDGLVCFPLFITGDNFLNYKDNLSRAIEVLQKAFATFLLERNKGDLFFSCSRSFEIPWDNFFFYLIDIINTIQKIEPTRFYLFFDEIMWLGDKGKFLSCYGQFINQQSYDNSKVSSFLASSSSSWMTSNVLHNKNSLYKRTIHLKLEPFTFKEVCSFFEVNKWHSNKNEIIKYYLLFGGYLKHYLDSGLDLTLTLEENFRDESTFKKFRDYISSEVEVFFSGIFRKTDKYQSLLKEIAKKQQISSSELLKPNLTAANLNKLLLDLERSNIIQSYTKEIQKFYFCNIPIMNFHYLFNNDFISDAEINVWKGRMFETLVFSNIDKVVKSFGLKKFSKILDFKILNSDVEEGGDNNTLTQYDILVEERGRDKLKRPKVLVFEVKCKPSSNITGEERNKFQNKSDFLKYFFQEKGQNIKTFNYFILPFSTTDLSFFDYC